MIDDLPSRETDVQDVGNEVTQLDEAARRVLSGDSACLRSNAMTSVTESENTCGPHSGGDERNAVHAKSDGKLANPTVRFDFSHSQSKKQRKRNAQDTLVEDGEVLQESSSYRDGKEPARKKLRSVAPQTNVPVSVMPRAIWDNLDSYPSFPNDLEQRGSGDNQALQSPLGSDRPPRRFSLLNAFCRRPELLAHLISWLPMRSLITLYSISKPFHIVFNEHETSFILASMRNWAPGADRIFPWHCYRPLTGKDPHQRRSDLWLGQVPKQNFHDLRDIPSLRWLQMVVWREGICKDMMIQLAIHGLLCPSGTFDAVKRMWFILDMPLNCQRIALIHSRTYITNDVIERMMFFLLKVDMHLSDPIPPAFPLHPVGRPRFTPKFTGALVSGVSLRKALLAEEHLTPLWRVLHGWSWDTSKPQEPMSRMDIFRLWVRHHYTPRENLSTQIKQQNIMGIPWWEVGAASLERVGVGYLELDGKRHMVHHPTIIGSTTDPSVSAHRAAQLERQHEALYPHRRRIVLSHERPRQRLLRPDELCIAESVRRQMSMHTRWVDMMLYGFCDDYGNTIPVKSEDWYLGRERGMPLSK